MARISVYTNSQASRSKAQFSKEEFKNFFFRHELNYYSPATLDLLHEQLTIDIESGVDYIISVGGDGSANTISQRLIGKSTKLLVLPGGTANDFAHELGTSCSLRKAFQIFNSSEIKKIDAININGRYMVTNGGIGIASEVARTVDKMRKKSPLFKKMMKYLGKETYSLVYAQQLLAKAFATHSLFVESKDLPLMDPRITTPLVLINNQEFIGGKFRVAPHTRNTDGKFNVAIFLHESKLDFMKCTLQMMQGIYPKNDKKLISFETDQIIINSLNEKPLRFFGDGEMFDEAHILNISMEAGALNVCSLNEEAMIHQDHPLQDIELIV
ncbi:MAG TPA: diacylglycerol kinase family protein [Bacteriovoracaceae bacterium]|nr:diacylglycerol kinase family protein [Bacteriovoracaceae bacterium]